MPERTCRSCGCTDANACTIREDDVTTTCRWVEPDLCSGCVDLPEQTRVTGPMPVFDVTVTPNTVITDVEIVGITIGAHGDLITSLRGHFEDGRAFQAIWPGTWTAAVVEEGSTT